MLWPCDVFAAALADIERERLDEADPGKAGNRQKTQQQSRHALMVARYGKTGPWW